MKKAEIIKRVNCKAGTLLILLFILSVKSNAQFDPMFTQYMNNEMFINPAYTGTRDAMAATLLYRDQWAGITGAPKTQTFTLHSPFGENWGAGISAMNEQIGITHQLRVYGNYAFRVRASEDGQLSFGLQGGFIHLKQNFSELTLNNQTDLVFTQNNPSVTAPNAGFGMYYYTDKYYVGFSIPRLLKNSYRAGGSSTVQNTASPHDWHLYLTAAYVFEVSDNFKFKPSFMIKEVYGAPVEAEIAAHGLVKDFWWIGASYRTGDAVTAITGFQVSPQFRVLYSYDYSLTRLQNYNSGSHEITLGYDFAYKKNKIASPRLF